MATALAHPEVLDAYILEELDAGRVSGPFTQDQVEEILGPFYSCPLGLVPKAGDALQWRIVRNLSARDEDGVSVNDLLDPDLLPTSWGTAAMVAEMVAQAPEGAEAATGDIAKAYRTIPIHPEHKRLVVFQHRGLFFIDHCVPFGLSPAAGMQGVVADAAVDILTISGAPSLKWVDDLIHFRYPRYRRVDGEWVYDYDRRLLRELLAPLRIPWHPDKGSEFSPTVQYVGFLWDLAQKRVSLPKEKQQKYLAKLLTFVDLPAVTLEQVNSLNGTLSHVAFVVRDGRAYLPGLSAFASSFDISRKHQTRHPPASVLSDLRWWRDVLGQPTLYRSLAPRGHPIDPGIWVDASSEWGIGLVFGTSWDAWRLREGWRSDGREIGWAEAVALEMALLAMRASGIHDADVIVRGDNTGVIGAQKRGRGRNVHVNAVLRRLDQVCRELNVVLHPFYVESAANLADPYSRGQFDGSLARSDLSILLPPDVLPFVEAIAR